MLKIIRKKARLIMTLIAILIIPAFILWGVPNQKGKKRYAGVVLGKKISWDRYYRNLRACEHQAKLIYGDKFNELRKKLDLEKQTWQRLILLEKAKRRGIKVEDKEVIAAIEKIPLFQDKEGFNKKRYDQILKYLRVEAREFEEEIRDSLKISKIADLKNLEKE